jgi:hypothetical protein
MENKWSCWYTEKELRDHSVLTTLLFPSPTNNAANLCSLVEPWGIFLPTFFPFLFVKTICRTASYVLLGTEAGMKEAFGSTCHGAGRQLSRHKSRNVLHANDVLAKMKSQGISLRIQTPKLVMEEVRGKREGGRGEELKITIFTGARDLQGCTPGHRHLCTCGLVQKMCPLEAHRRHQGLNCIFVLYLLYSPLYLYDM